MLGSILFYSLGFVFSTLLTDILFCVLIIFLNRFASSIVAKLPSALPHSISSSLLVVWLLVSVFNGQGWTLLESENYSRVSCYVCFFLNPLSYVLPTHHPGLAKIILSSDAHKFNRFKYEQSWTALFRAFSSHRQPSAIFSKVLPVEQTSWPNWQTLMACREPDA